MRYEGKIFRPPSEADAYILQATVGCSWNRCTYCDMYSDKVYRERETDACLEDLRTAAAIAKNRVDKVFVGDGDALGMPTDRWLAILKAADAGFPRLRRVSCYATAINILKKTPDELAALRAAGLSRLYIGPESGDDATLKRIAKGSTFAEHVAAAERARAAGIELSVIVLLGIAGTERAREHASATARLITAMDPAFASALTTTVVPKTPLHAADPRPLRAAVGGRDARRAADHRRRGAPHRRAVPHQPRVELPGHRRPPAARPRDDPGDHRQRDRGRGDPAPRVGPRAVAPGPSETCSQEHV
ncbi:radical SAM protein [Nannocystis pusilla]|uniref:radical SAM protein n=1 Tax=Nannocystis pusilla TaxID=889268 RepID=UPI003B794C00